MCTASLDGSDIRVVDDSGHTSHFIWKDERHILAFSRPAGEERAFYLFDETNGDYTCVIDEQMDGHCVYLPGNEWILNDTYPQGPERRQTLYLYRVSDAKRVVLGEFPSLPGYTGEWRCDLHARFNADGTKVCFDSAHEEGRQLYLMNIEDLRS